MKVLLCERNTTGHRSDYIHGILKNEIVDFFLISPEKNGNYEKIHYKCEKVNNRKSFVEYCRWINLIKCIAKELDVDIIHFLDGDSIMRFMGFGFRRLRKKIIITFHHYFDMPIKKIMYKKMSSKGKQCFIVHTEEVMNRLENIHIRNIYQCTYPCFSYNSLIKKNIGISKNKYGLSDSIPTIGIIGGMNKYKNIIKFLSVLSEVDKSFNLLICGKENDIKEADINNSIKNYRNSVIMKLGQLSNEEYEDAIAASDIIFAIYDKSFDGASGPVTDGVCLQKLILSSNHGSLGRLIKENHLGYVADCDNATEIKNITIQAIDNCHYFVYDKYAQIYLDKVNPSYFRQKHIEIYNNVIE